MFLPAAKTLRNDGHGMKSLYLRIWLTVVAALALFALVSGWMWQRHIEQERVRLEAASSERLAAWADLVQRALPASDAPVAEQAEALREWAGRLRVPLALDDRRGMRIAASDSFLRRDVEGNLKAAAVRLDDGRTLWLARRMLRRSPPDGGPADGMPGWRGGGAGPLLPYPPRGPIFGEQVAGPALGGRPTGAHTPSALTPGSLSAGGLSAGGLSAPDPGGLSMLPGMPVMGPMSLGLPQALGPLILVAMLFVAVAAGAFPVVRRLTRRLEDLKRGVQAFGAGDLAQRVDATGRDEVAAVAVTFNQAAQRIETLVRSHQTLLANASHELRSPLARLKMAVALYADGRTGLTGLSGPSGPSGPSGLNAPSGPDGPPDGPPDDPMVALRREIDANVAELDALVEEVLLASRLDSGPGLERHGGIELVALAAEEAARVGAEVEALGAAVAQPGQAPQPEVIGNERLLRRALRNLLENARRYGGGEITVQVEVSAGGAAQVRVCDRGPGVPVDLREQIFEPFFRLPGHAEREGGVGLGLSLVRQIAQRHGGSVHCEARDRGGSCFVIRLPAGPALPPVPPPVP